MALVNDMTIREYLDRTQHKTNFKTIIVVDVLSLTCSNNSLCSMYIVPKYKYIFYKRMYSRVHANHI